MPAFPRRWPTPQRPCPTHWVPLSRFMSPTSQRLRVTSRPPASASKSLPRAALAGSPAAGLPTAAIGVASCCRDRPSHPTLRCAPFAAPRTYLLRAPQNRSPIAAERPPLCGRIWASSPGLQPHLFTPPARVWWGWGMGEATGEARARAVQQSRLVLPPSPPSPLVSALHVPIVCGTPVRRARPAPSGEVGGAQPEHGPARYTPSSRACPGPPAPCRAGPALGATAL
jgi:hypothetical protein